MADSEGPDHGPITQEKSGRGVGDRSLATTTQSSSKIACIPLHIRWHSYYCTIKYFRLFCIQHADREYEMAG